MKNSVLFLLPVFFFFSTTAQNSACTDIGFEGLPIGPNASNAWVSMTGSAYGSIICAPVNPLSYTLNNLTSNIVTTPLIDPMCPNVNSSPFRSGNKVMCLNKGALGTRTKLTQNFFVTNSNSVYRYAYMGVLESGHLACDAGSLIFNFYDCNNNPISALSKTIQSSPFLANNIDGAYWSAGGSYTVGGPANNQITYTPNWVVHTANLKSYVGSCITVEVIASACVCGAWQGYCYYDSECSGGIIETSGNTLRDNVNSYTTCASSTTLAALPGYVSYLWQGPVNSGVSGSTSPSITTSIAGAYSLTASDGTVNVTEAFNLTFAGTPTLNISTSSPSNCIGGTVTLQASGNGLMNCNWYTATVPFNNAFSIAVSPILNTIYSASGVNSFGCSAFSLKNISLAPSPQLVQINASDIAICPGKSVNLVAAGNANTSYTWSTGSNASSMLQTPSMTSVFSVSATNTLGCVSSDAITITVHPVTPVQILSSSNWVCSGQSVNLSLPGQGIVSYTWSTGQMSQPVSPIITTSSFFTVEATDINGCKNAANVSIAAMPLPNIQLTASAPLICIGQGVSLTASSDQTGTYSWSTGSLLNTTYDVPQATTVYNVTVTGPLCSNSASMAVTVAPLPQVQIIVPAMICSGESAVLSINGSNIITYTWSNGDTGPLAMVTPEINTLYSVTVTDNNGCSSTTTEMLEVDKCTGIASNSPASSLRLEVFPNPANGLFTIRSSGETRGIIVNMLGQVVKEFSLNAANNFSQSLSGFATGIYQVKAPAASTKVIVE